MYNTTIKHRRYCYITIFIQGKHWKIENADAFIIVFLAYGLKKQGYTLDQCVEELAKGFDKKSTDYLEAIGLIYRAWNLEV